MRRRVDAAHAPGRQAADRRALRGAQLERLDQSLERPVGGAVVHGHDLERGVVEPEQCTHGVHDGARVVARGKQDADRGRLIALEEVERVGEELAAVLPSDFVRCEEPERQMRNEGGGAVDEEDRDDHVQAECGSREMATCPCRLSHIVKSAQRARRF